MNGPHTRTQAQTIFIGIYHPQMGFLILNREHGNAKSKRFLGKITAFQARFSA